MCEILENFVAKCARHVHLKFRAKNMKILNFDVEQKLDHHFLVEFDGESNGNSLKSLKP